MQRQLALQWLINSTNMYDDGGLRHNVSITGGTSYRIRFVDAAVDTHFKFSTDNYTLHVVDSDLVLITPSCLLRLTMPQC
jgi:hypothetical protein